jgi:hypothetical protein
MQIEHGVLGSAYPVVGGTRVDMSDALDEYEAQKADAETADYTFEQAEAFEPPPVEAPDEPAGSVSTLEEPEDFTVDPSATSVSSPAKRPLACCVLRKRSLSKITGKTRCTTP